MVIKLNPVVMNWIVLLQDGLSDIAFADLYLKPERKVFMNYLRAHGTGNLCFLVSKPPLKSKWVDLVKPFQWPVWMVLIASMGVSCYLMHLYGQLTSEFSGNEGVLMLFAVFFDQSHAGLRRVK